MATIAHADGIITPDQVLRFQSDRDSGNIVHTIPGRVSPDVTLRPASLRTGTLELMFRDEQDSRDAEDAHATGSTFALIAPERPTVETFYVVTGTITRELDPQTRDRWIVRVDYQEIDPA